MNKTLFWLFLASILFCYCTQNSKPKRSSVVRSSFFIDSSKPFIESGFYLVVDDSETEIKKHLFSFLKETYNPEDYYLESSNFIPFNSIEKVSWREDTLFKNGFYVLDFKLNPSASKFLANLSANANKLRLNTPYGLRLGIIADNTLVQVVKISDSIPNGEMELSYMYNQNDVEILKRNFDDAILKAKNKQSLNSKHEKS